jgi:DNA helicase-2/ATP-dependent DNA helicase PcrA
MASNLLASLNNKQRKAVTFNEGPLLILAGAGSGKTRAIVYRVAYLISKKQIDPSRILLTTFTNKAASEMRERLISLVGSAPPFTGTFHSLCAKILRRQGKYIGIPPAYAIYDERDQEDVVKQALLDLDLSQRDFKPRSILAAISQAKNELIGPTEYPQYAKGYWQKTVSQVYLEYQKLLKKYEALDFDDLLMETVNLFKREPRVLNMFQDRFNHVLVDEYQDTNHAQYILTKLLAGRWRNLCCVGDASQSIYAWRGADFRNLTKLQHDFTDLTIVNLEHNYRSTQIILDAAYGVISNNKSHPVLSLWTDKKKGDLIDIFEASDEKEETEFVLQTIRNLIKENSQLSYKDFSVLYRTNAQSRVVEETLIRAGIPYVLVGGTRFYGRKEIKDCLAYLRVLANPKDMVSFKRLEKIGKRRLTDFSEYAEKFKAKKTKKVKNTLEILEDIFEATSYLDLYDPKDEEDLMRLDNIKELKSVAQEFPDLTEFLENVALVEQEHLPDKPITKRDKSNAVSLMTLHAAKGLGFPVVFIVGMEEGLFPHSRSMLEKEELEEERRLCYVGITRAKDRLFLSHARRRLYFGSYGSNIYSRFLSEIPEKLMNKVGFNLQYSRVNSSPDFIDDLEIS